MQFQTLNQFLNQQLVIINGNSIMSFMFVDENLISIIKN